MAYWSPPVPSRLLWNLKNARTLAAFTVSDAGFTRAHRPRSLEELATVLGEKQEWAIQSWQHGYLIPQRHDALVVDSRTDAPALNVILFVERVFVPLGPGQLQWGAIWYL